MEGLKIVFALVLLFLVCVSATFSIVSIVIGAQNLNSTCDASSFIRLSIWLIVYGSVNLIVLAGFLAPNGRVISVLIYVTDIIWNLAWNIVGAVALFRDSALCQSESQTLWGMTLAVLIWQWLHFAVICFGKKE